MSSAVGGMLQISMDARAAVLFSASLIVALALAEGALWASGFAAPILYAPDPLTGSTHRPNLAFTYTDEGRGQVRINSAGLRDREHAIAKPPGTYRIAVLGDSYAEALQVNQDEAFWAVMGREAHCLGDVEVINFGVSGYGTAQEMLMLERVWPYQPDLVLVAFLTGNDVRNNAKALEPGQVRPFFSLTGGRLVEDRSFLSHPLFVSAQSRYQVLKRELTDHSRILQLYSRIRSRPAPTGGSEPGLDDAVYAEPTGKWVDAWNVTRGLLSAMRSSVGQHGARFLVATLSNSIQVQPDAAVTEAFAREQGITDIFAPDRRIEAFGREDGYEVAVLAPDLQKIARTQGVLLHGFDGRGLGHWNQDGHRHAGELLARRLCP